MLAGTCLQAADNNNAFKIPDTATIHQKIAGDTLATHIIPVTNNTSTTWSDGNKTLVSDVEQMISTRRNTMVFIILLLLFIIITYLKVAFSKDFDELFQSLINQNLAQQIFRMQRGEITFSSAVLHFNFVITISLYVQFIMFHYLHVSPVEGISSTLLLIFLFTFFYLGKIMIIKTIGLVFEMQDECDEYIFNFVMVCKLLGLTLLPALFILYTAPVRYLDFIFSCTVVIFVVLLLLAIWRGLSTAYKLLYRSVYHFFIYVCVVEISSIFLLFKLLTKTIT